MQLFSQACLSVPISLNVLIDHRKASSKILQVGCKAQLECVKIVLDILVATVWARASMILQINFKQVFLTS